MVQAEFNLGNNFKLEPGLQTRIVGSGKTTLARIMAGLETPDSGLVIRSGTLSWPIGFSSGFHPMLSAAENVALVARLWNLDRDEYLARVEDFCELGRAFHGPVSDFSPGMRNQLGLALSQEEIAQLQAFLESLTGETPAVMASH